MARLIGGPQECELCEIDDSGNHAPRCPVALEAEVARLSALINTPHTAEFLEAVRLEAIHQRERWGSEHDAGKTDADWFWLVGYLAGKALHEGKRADEAAADGAAIMTKRVHHIITTAAALLNWHAAVTGTDTRMRPGIAPPLSED